MARGARVKENPILLSATSTSHLFAPLAASNATRCASSVPTKTASSRTATPRLTRGKPILRTFSEMSGDQVHNLLAGFYI